MILFYGDPHGEYGPLYNAVAECQPAHVILLGDMSLTRPLHVELADIFAAGIKVWYILGNHDTHTAEQHDFLLLDHPDGHLHSRVQEMDGMRVAGLGGVYRGRIWSPVNGDEEPRFRTRAAYIRQMNRPDRWRGGLPLRQVDSIFPEDHDALGRQQADVLVCHEAPSVLPTNHGFRAIDQLAARMRARLVVHGHHHLSYEARTDEGVAVKGLGLAEPWVMRIPALTG